MRCFIVERMLTRASIQKVQVLRTVGCWLFRRSHGDEDCLRTGNDGSAHPNPRAYSPWLPAPHRNLRHGRKRRHAVRGNGPAAELQVLLRDGGAHPLAHTSCQQNGRHGSCGDGLDCTAGETGGEGTVRQMW